MGKSEMRVDSGCWDGNDKVIRKEENICNKYYKSLFLYYITSFFKINNGIEKWIEGINGL